MIIAQHNAYCMHVT